MTTATMIVRCKCDGAAGAARVEHNYTANPIGTAFFEAARGFSVWFRCWTCRAPFKAVEIRGRRTAHECDARCLAGKGATCECACGGKNHGASFC